MVNFNRRGFLLTGIAATLLGTTSAQAVTVRKPNGEYDGEWFHWNLIGVDEYGGTLREALVLLGIPQRYHDEIAQTIESTPGEVIQIQEYHRFDAMVSGGRRSGSVSWVAQRVWPHPETNSNGRWSDNDRRMETWTFVFGNTTVTVGRPLLCDNWTTAVTVGHPFTCRCDTRFDVGC